MNKREKSGFTIVEVLVAGLLIVVLGTAILGLTKVIGDSQLFGLTNYLNVDEANYSVTAMAREIRTMRQGQNGSYPLVYGNDNEISFYSDIDYDGESELVRYYLTADTFYKDITEPQGFPATYPSGTETTRIIAENIDNGADPVFIYFNADWPIDTTNNPLPVPVGLF